LHYQIKKSKKMNTKATTNSPFNREVWNRIMQLLDSNNNRNSVYLSEACRKIYTAVQSDASPANFDHLFEEEQELSYRMGVILRREISNFMENGNKEEALVRLELLLSCCGETLQNFQLAAQVYLEICEWKKSLHFAEKAVALNEQDPQNFYLRARAYSCLDRDELAMDDLNFALLLQPCHVSALMQRAMLRHIQGASKSAVHDLRKAIQQDTGNEEAWRMLGKVYFDMHKLAESYTALREVLKLNPFDRDALYLSASIRLHLGLELKTAGTQLEMAAALGHIAAGQKLSALRQGRHAN
jgi:tetratricopeptide (TPR) repeat protein